MAESLRIGGYVVDTSLNRVTTPAGMTVQVEPKVMSVLVALAARPGEVVTRDELLAQVWRGVFVTDDAVHRTIRELRRLFDDDADAPRVIETIRKRGYRLIASVGPVPDAEYPGVGSGVRPGDGSGVRSGVRPGDRSRVRSGVRPGDRSWVRSGVRYGVRPRASAVVAVAVVLVAVVAVARFSTRASAGRATALRVTFNPLTSDPGNEVDPALSASGKLAYVARASDGRAHIFMKMSGASPATQLTDGDASEHSPAWSPDEQQIVFVRMNERGCQIMIRALSGGDARTLLPCLSHSELKMSWSPDGDRLAVTAGNGTLSSPSHIELVSMRDGSHHPATDPPAGHAGDYSPAFAPDGRAIAFVRAASGGVTSLNVRDLAADSEQVVFSDGSDILGVDWSPDAKSLIFSSDRGGAISVWRIPTAATSASPAIEPELLAGGGAKLKHPTVARLTGAIAYEDWQYEINLRDAPTGPDRDDAVPLSATSDRWNFQPQLSPDGSQIIFQSTRSGQYEFWVSDRHGSNARIVTSSRLYKSAPRWSPDGRLVAYTMRSGDAPDEIAAVTTVLCLLDIATGTSRVLTRWNTAPVAITAWSHDGRRVYVSGAPRGHYQIHTVAIASGESTLVRDNAYGAAESFDGRWLYFGRIDRAGLWRTPIAGGADTLVTERATGEQWPNWGTCARGLFFVGYPDDGDPQLFLVKDGAHEVTAMTRLAEMSWAGIAVSADASRVIYAHADRRSSNIGGMTVSP